jgi:tungstate transport system ATP-binding protein
MMEVKNLRLVRDGREILNIGELVVERGEVLAIVGPNGAGKSSLLLTLAALQPPTSGTIHLDGRIMGNGNLLALRRRMALVFQEALLLDATVQRNITLALRMRGISRSEATTRAQKWLDRFGIAHLASRSARKLSGGEAQRTSLARAFALEPEILLLDEPFAALDYPTRKALLRELGQLLESMHLTTLFVTHDYTEIPYLAKKTVVLYEGKVIRSGSVEDIFGKELLQRETKVPWES